MNPKSLARWLAHRGADVVHALHAYNGIEKLGIARYARGKVFEGMLNRMR